MADLSPPEIIEQQLEALIGPRPAESSVDMFRRLTSEGMEPTKALGEAVSCHLRYQVMRQEALCWIAVVYGDPSKPRPAGVIKARQ